MGLADLVYAQELKDGAGLEGIDMLGCIPTAILPIPPIKHNVPKLAYCTLFQVRIGLRNNIYDFFEGTLRVVNQPDKDGYGLGSASAAANYPNLPP